MSGLAGAGHSIQDTSEDTVGAGAPETAAIFSSFALSPREALPTYMHEKCIVFFMHIAITEGDNIN
jgi:hypothetical protein